jgi:spermidine/putrescine transport system permease protein
VRRGLWSSFLVPPGLWLAVFYLVPLGLIIAASFGQVDFLGRVLYAWPFAGWDLSNYHTVLSSAYLPAFFRSLAFALLTTALCLLIGYPVAYVIARYGGRVRHLLVVLLVLPWFVDYLIRVYAWIVLLGDNGVVNGWLHDLGMAGDPPVQFLGTWWAVVGGLFYSYFPFMVLPIFAAVDRMDSSLVEAGKDLYGTPWQTFRHVTFPATFQGVVAGAVLVFLPAAGDFANSEFLGSPGTSMIGNVINSTFNAGGYVPLGGTLTVCFMAGIAVFMVFYLRSAARASREGAM